MFTIRRSNALKTLSNISPPSSATDSCVIILSYKRTWIILLPLKSKHLDR